MSIKLNFVFGHLNPQKLPMYINGCSCYIKKQIGFVCFRVSKCCLIKSLFVCITVLTDDPNFAEPIPNVTVSLGRDASLPCVVNNLGTYKVRCHVHNIIIIIITGIVSMVL